MELQWLALILIVLLGVGLLQVGSWAWGRWRNRLARKQDTVYASRDPLANIQHNTKETK